MIRTLGLLVSTLAVAAAVIVACSEDRPVTITKWVFTDSDLIWCSLHGIPMKECPPVDDARYVTETVTTTFAPPPTSTIPTP